MKEHMDTIGGIDAGGTTFKCGLADLSGRIFARARVPVTHPQETIAGCLDFFNAHASSGQMQALGLASFGPLDLDVASDKFGTLLNTPKPGWSGVNLRQIFAERLNLQVALDTDVNGALLAEMTCGAARGVASAAYVTIGTGIGAGIYANGDFLGRPSHPEFGHIPVKRHPEDVTAQGSCPFHGDCLEGLASASAIRARFGEPAELAPEDPAWPIIADYLSQACRSLTLTLRPERIILGGGLMLAPHLIGRVRDAYRDQLAGYLGDGADSSGDLIVTPQLGDDAGLVGAILLAIARSKSTGC